MHFFQTLQKVYILGNNKELNTKLNQALDAFYSFWNPQVQIHVVSNYLDLNFNTPNENVLFVTTEHGLEQLDQPTIFSVIKKYFSKCRILHMYEALPPHQLDKKELNAIDQFVNFETHGSLQFKRILHQINY